MKNPLIYLLTLQECIQRIKEYAAGYDLDSFISDKKTQDAVIRNIEVIGQAVKDHGIQPLLERYPDIPWQQVAGMRNIIAHEYLGIDMVITWEVVSTHLTLLEQAVTDLIQNSK